MNEQQQQKEIQKKRSRWLQLLDEYGQDEDNSNNEQNNVCTHNDGQQQCNECRYYIENFDRLRLKFQNLNDHHQTASTSGFFLLLSFTLSILSCDIM